MVGKPIASRISAHVQKMKRKIAMHFMRHTITEIEVIPEHDLRTASPLYLSNRHKLIEEQKFRCWVCDASDDLEAHHWTEWAEAGNVDWHKAADILERLDFHGYGKSAMTDPISDPDHISNLCVLCRKCHREKGFGIHDTTGPVWWARKARKAGVHVVKAI